MSRAVRVLYVVVHGEMGGVHRFVDAVLARHDPDCVRPSVLAFRDGPWLESLARRGTTVHCVPDARLRALPSATRAIRRVLETEASDIVHSSSVWCHALVTPAARSRRCRTIAFQHDPIPDRWWQGFLSLVPADLRLANSRFVEARLRRSSYVSGRTAVVHLALDPSAFAPAPPARATFRRAWGLPSDTVAVGIVGFIDTWKGQDVFLDAARRLGATNLPLRFFVVGGPREGTPRSAAALQALVEYTRAHRLEDVVAFTGHTDLQAGPLDGLDIMVHASTEPEPFGMVILEAMAKGRTVIASNEGGPREIVTHDLDGWLVEPRSPQKLADAIAALAGDPARRARLGAAAMRTVTSRFHARRAAEDLENHYVRLR